MVNRKLWCMNPDQELTKPPRSGWARRPSKRQKILIIGLAIVGMLWFGFQYLVGPSTARMSEELQAIGLPTNFHRVGDVHGNSSGSFAGDCFDACSGANLLAENQQSISASDNEKNLETADALVKSAGWRLVSSYKDDSSYKYQKELGDSASKIGSVMNTYCKPRMRLEVTSRQRYPFGSDVAHLNDADILAGMEYDLQSKNCS